MLLCMLFLCKSTFYIVKTWTVNRTVRTCWRVGYRKFIFWEIGLKTKVYFDRSAGPFNEMKPDKAIELPAHPQTYIFILWDFPKLFIFLVFSSNLSLTDFICY